MRKLIALLSITCLALVLSVASANAGSMAIHETTPQGTTVVGTLTVTPGNVSLNATVTTAAGQSYTVVANGTTSGTWPNVSVSGNVTVSQGSTVVQTVTVTGTGPNWVVAAVGFINKTISLVP
jgi:hypothetical protein